MYEHSTGYTFDAALELARTLKHGPLPAASDPTPTPEEAIQIIREERRTCGFNWITGEVAVNVISAYMAGAKAAKNAASPYPDWSDEHRAWMQGVHAVTGSKTMCLIT